MEMPQLSEQNLDDVIDNRLAIDVCPSEVPPCERIVDDRFAMHWKIDRSGQGTHGMRPIVNCGGFGAREAGDGDPLNALPVPRSAAGRRRGRRMAGRRFGQ
jgi:hypothetical protein